MNKKAIVCKRRMTLTEIMFAVALLAILTAMAYPIIVNAMHQVSAGTWQARFIDEARISQQRLNRVIQQHKYMDLLDESTVRLYDIKGDISVVRYVDNEIVLEKDGTTQVLSSFVSPISEDDPIFSYFPSPHSSRQRLRIAMHIGDPPDGGERKFETGPGYQGVELRFSASPRNLQEWHSF